MSHKADKSFFNKKRHWSKRKDKILERYLLPYLLKIATQKAPILIVDAFAGPGKFGDGELGSPLIICQNIQTALSKGISVSVSTLCIEAEEKLFSELSRSIEQFPFATPCVQLRTHRTRIPAPVSGRWFGSTIHFG